jgi:hypothetical protein
VRVVPQELFLPVAVVVVEIRSCHQLLLSVEPVVVVLHPQVALKQALQLHQLQPTVVQLINLSPVFPGIAEEVAVEALALEEQKQVEMEPLLITQELRLVMAQVVVVLQNKIRQPILSVPQELQTPVTAVAEQRQVPPVTVIHH